MKSSKRRWNKFRHLIALVVICLGILGYTKANVKAASTDIGFTLNLFCISENGPANHVALNWATTLSADSYIVYRSTNATSGFTIIYNGTGTSYQDYDLAIGTTYYYKLEVISAGTSTVSEVKTITPSDLPSGLNTYNNQTGSSIVYGASGTKVGNTYYSYSVRSHDGENDIYIVERVSSDGINFTDSRTVLDKNGNDALASCKLESVQMTYVESIGKMVIWAHWEKPSGYADGKALVVTGTPGGDFTVHHVYNPLDIYVRDMSIFIDDDGTGYLIAAANVAGQGANATIYIFKMNASFSDVTEVVAKVHENQYREFPHMIKRDGYYYLFTSQAAGWYPSKGGYTSTNNLYGTWSDLRSVGNSSTFSSQSGWILHLGDSQNFMMHAYRWIAAEGTSGATLLPVYFSNGFAFYDYYPMLKYNVSTGDLYPVQYGKLVSQNKSANASLPAAAGSDAGKAFDGSYGSYYAATSSKWPFYLQVDLEQAYDLSNIQISWFMYKGSEAYYAYTVEGSLDGITWTTLLDRSDTSSSLVKSTYGFSSNLFSGTARYVRLSVKNAYLHNNPNNWYTPTVFEVKLYGTLSSQQSSVVPYVKYDFNENLSGNQCVDSSGNLNHATLYGNATYVNDSEKGKVMYLDGSNGTYAQLPTGIFDGIQDITISMDVKSQSTGNFFTFAIGQNDTKYFFYKVSNSQVRYAITTNYWAGETGLSHNISADRWHNYTAVLSGSTLKLYIDGVLVSTVTSIATHIKDLGDNLISYIGKSFYSADSYFNGFIDDVVIYQQALSAAEVAALQN